MFVIWHSDATIVSRYPVPYDTIGLYDFKARLSIALKIKPLLIIVENEPRLNILSRLR